MSWLGLCLAWCWGIHMVMSDKQSWLEVTPDRAVNCEAEVWRTSACLPSQGSCFSFLFSPFDLECSLPFLDMLTHSLLILISFFGTILQHAIYAGRMHCQCLWYVVHPCRPKPFAKSQFMSKQGMAAQEMELWWRWLSPLPCTANTFSRGVSGIAHSTSGHWYLRQLSWEAVASMAELSKSMWQARALSLESFL